MKRLKVTRMLVITVILVAFIATGIGTSFAATSSSPSQNYAQKLQARALGTVPNGSANTNTFAQDSQAVGASLQGAGAFLTGVAAVGGLITTVTTSSSSSSSAIVNPINSNVTPSVKDAFGR